MKKAYVLLMTTIVFILIAGCAQSVPPAASSGLDEWGITLTAQDVTPTGLTLVCTQSGGDPLDELYTGRAFSLERFKNGEWKPQHTLVASDSLVWTLEALGIPYEGSVEWEVGWEFLYGKLPPGIYRIKKAIRGYRGMGAFESRPYYAQFTITD